MDISSVASIGGGAALFPFNENSQYSNSFRRYEYPSPSPPPRSNFVVSPMYGPADMIERCEHTAQRIQQRHRNVYGAIEDSISIQRGDSRRGALFCRSGNWLEIKDERSITNREEKDWRRRTVIGSPVSKTPYGMLDFISVAIGLISIRGVETNRYLCMDKEGMLYSTRLSNFSSECVFLEEMMENYFNLYSSCLYGNRKRPWYVALQKNGHPRRGTRTKRRRKASHFLVVHYDSASPKDGIQLDDLLIPSLRHQPPRYNRRLTETIQSTQRQNSLASDQSPQRDKQRRKLRRQREKKKKRRREHRLQLQEKRRKERREELARLRAAEVERNRELELRRYQSSRLSGAGLLRGPPPTTARTVPQISRARRITR